MEQLKTIGREFAMGSQGAFGQSKEFLDLIKSIGEARSKAEEDRIVLREIETLKSRLSNPNTTKLKLREYIIRLLYVEMLGHDASFGYIHAVKMTHDENLLLKRTGYLAVTLFLNEDHDLIILIVNTIQKDLKSDNYLAVCAALNAACKLINEETIPAILPQVVELLGHQMEAVRKKAVMALHRFHQKSPGSVSHLISNFRRRLSDNDPGVMGAALCPLFDLILAEPDVYKDLVVSLVNILKQVVERKLPKSYDYRQMPAPFIQIKLLKILSLLGSGDKKASEQMYTTVGDIMREIDSTSNIGNAILYECICCVSSLHPNPKLLEAVAEAISKFFKSESHNMKYLGIDALSRLIKIGPEIAEQHQLAVIDCLEDPDDTLKRKTFELLYKMTKSSNVEVIVERMIEYMINISDTHYKAEIASRCVELAEQFAPSHQWFILTMNKVFEHAGDLVNAKVAHNLMRLIAEGFGEDDNAANSLLRSFAVESYLQIMGEPIVPSAFLQLICWVLGEYGTADGKYSASYITGKLCDVAEANASDDVVKAFVATALLKIYSFEIAAGRAVDMLPECKSLIEDMLASHSTILQQHAYELKAVLCLDAQAVKTIMPMDSSCDDIELDKNLSFLDVYVQQALENGAQPYIPENERSGLPIISKILEDQESTTSPALRFEAYELPKPSVAPNGTPSTELVPVSELPYAADIHQPSPAIASASGAGSTELKLRLDGVQRKWGRPTYSSPGPSTSSTDTVNIQHEPTQSNPVSLSDSIARDASYNSGKPGTKISPEKRRLAAWIFGDASKPEDRQLSSNQKVSSKYQNSGKARASRTAAENPSRPPPDLLDMSEPSVAAATVDPFKQFEGLLDLTQDNAPASAAGTSDFMPLFADMPLNAPSDGNNNSMPSAFGRNGYSSNGVEHSAQQFNKGSNLKEALEKDALVRHTGVTPLGQNPNLLKDLLR
ncbi:AP-4 complex subunit epsilon-like isoform X2 [Andrographis paniculata]|uniref:AP-4 complex subunit epsilon-like isoform X2 n=1 Tax=Andrographis paniculata TaxID=175694 RepID=UPI0021E87975|nr:AP-4 complex subunit epsilon-like isoform X2 [Andrographis paniculata]